MAIWKICIAFSIIVITAASHMDPKILGGVQTTIDKYPHAAFLTMSWKSHWTCGTSIVNQVVLLTAAHCVVIGGGSYRAEIHAGHENYEKSNIRRVVKTYAAHPGYDEKIYYHDIALLFLENPLPLGNKIKRVIISEHFPVVNIAELAGWGNIADQRITGAKTSTAILFSIKQKILTRKQCSKYLKMYPGLLCAGDPKGRLGWPGFGDSGSALMASSQQIGLVSFTLDNSHGVTFYTNISFYYTWIEFRTQQNLCER